MSETYHEKVSPTALAVAYYRTQTDIPYSKEIFEALGGDPKYVGPPDLAPMFEARYKLTDRLLRESGAAQILEIAAGFSPRGAIWSRDPSITYVETDMPKILQQKKELLKDLKAESSNLFLEEANALDLEALSRAAEHFKSGPITIVNEGLMRYLTMDEKAKLAQNIHTLLKKFGGVWITPDITISAEQPTTGAHEYMQNITGAGIPKNGFSSVEAAAEFFSKHGFSVERHHYKEMLDSLVSLQKLGLRPEQCEYSLEREAFVMRPI